MFESNPAHPRHPLWQAQQSAALDCRRLEDVRKQIAGLLSSSPIRRISGMADMALGIEALAGEYEKELEAVHRAADIAYFRDAGTPEALAYIASEYGEKP